VLTVTQDELAEVTRRGRPSAQARVLRRLGIPLRIHPTDGVLLVARDAVLKALGNDSLGATAYNSDQYVVNVDAIRRHGAAA
jgi:hypothetical protein